MSARVGVYKLGRDWYAECLDHDDEGICAGSWSDAYEAALGHICMWHSTTDGGA